MPRRPNRTALTPDEKSSLDKIMSAYAERRKASRTAMQEAMQAYQEANLDAVQERDSAILKTIGDSPDRGLMARISEYIGISSSYLYVRLKQARDRGAEDGERAA